MPSLFPEPQHPKPFRSRRRRTTLPSPRDAAPPPRDTALLAARPAAASSSLGELRLEASGGGRAEVAPEPYSSDFICRILLPSPLTPGHEGLPGTRSGCHGPDPAAMDQIQRHGRTAQPPSCAPLPDLGRCRGRCRSSTPTLGFGPWSCPPAPPTAPPTPSSPSSSTMPWPQGQHPPTSCSPSPAATTDKIAKIGLQSLCFAYFPFQMLTS